MFYSFRRNNNDLKKIIKWHTVLLSHLPQQPRLRWWRDTLQPLWPSWEIKNCLPSWMTAINFFFFLSSSPSLSLLLFIWKEKTETTCSFCLKTRCITHREESSWFISSVLLLTHIAVNLSVLFSVFFILQYFHQYPMKTLPVELRCPGYDGNSWDFFFPLFQQQA